MNAQYVGFGRRLVAWFVDLIVLFVVQTLVLMVLGVGTLNVSTSAALNTTSSTAGWLSYVVSIVISIGYWVVLQSQMGQTLGKKALGIRVVDSTGGKPSMMTFFLREIIGKIVSAIILLIGYLMVLWDGKKQGLHDKIAGTYVVRV